MAGWEQQLEAGAERVLGRPLAGAERQAFSKYLDLLLNWQRVHRLVGSSDPEWIARELFTDSLVFVHVIPADARRVLDFGSGAGFPGIPIAIVRTDLDVTLLEARRRRASFLSTVVRELRLPNVRVVAERGETVGEEFGGAFDVVVMRCAGPVTEVMPLALAMVKPGGIAVASGPPASRVGDAPVEWVRVDAGDAGAGRWFAVATRTFPVQPA